MTKATLVVNLTDIKKRSRKQAAIESDIRNALSSLAGVRVEVGTGGNGTKLELTLASDDPTSLEQAGSALEEQLRTLKGIGAVTSSAALQAPEIQIRPDFAKAAALGITSETIAEAVRVSTNGDYSNALAKLNLPQRQIPIRVRFNANSCEDIDAISQLQVAGANGKVALGSIAAISIGGSPSELDRIDRARNITLSIELNGRILGT